MIADVARLWQFLDIRESIVSNLLTEDRWKMMLEGLSVTLEISLLSLLFATLIGTFFCAMRMSRKRAASGLAWFYIELMRSLPLLLLLLVMFYLVLASSSLSETHIAVVCFSMYFGAYFCEVFRSGIMGVDKGQWEAGSALGMNKIMVLRKIVLPQALLRVLPVQGQRRAGRPDQGQRRYPIADLRRILPTTSDCSYLFDSVLAVRCDYRRTRKAVNP